MSILTDVEILEAIEQKEIKIEPFDDPGMLVGVTYDLRVGGECYIGGQEDKIYLSDDPSGKHSLHIPPRQFAILETYESITFGPSIAGRFGLISKYSKKGLVFLSGPVVDPTFSGSIKIGIYNTSSHDIYLSFKEPICTIVFYKVGQIKNLPKNLDNLGRGIKSDDVDYLKTNYGLSEFEKRLSKIENNFILMKKIGWIVLAALISGFIGFLFGMFSW